MDQFHVAFFAVLNSSSRLIALQQSQGTRSWIFGWWDKVALPSIVITFLGLSSSDALHYHVASSRFIYLDSCRRHSEVSGWGEEICNLLILVLFGLLQLVNNNFWLTLFSNIGSPCGVMVKVCGFEFLSRYFIYFPTNTLRKGMNCFIPLSYGYDRIPTVLLGSFLLLNNTRRLV